MPKQVYRFSERLKTFIFILGVISIIILMFYTNSIVDKLRSQSRVSLEFYAKLYSKAVEEERVEYLNFIFEEIIKKSNFPIISTNKDKIPNYWEGISVDPEDHSPVAIEDVKKIMAMMEQEFDPIPIKNPFQNTGQEILGFLYYGDSNLITQLIWLPYIEILLFGLFIIITYVAFKSIKKSEQRLIWVGMAKETAHQLGTPLSSLMGWTELMKSNTAKENVENILIEMENDIRRLYKITARFSQIGSHAELKEMEITPILSHVVDYFNKRLPHMSKKIEIIENYSSVSTVKLNRELFEWVIENLIKNSLDAIEKDKGTISITLNQLKEDSNRIMIDVKDNGKGIGIKDKKMIFKPGFSTKKRGWGLGLNLSKRIIEEYHHGKLMLKETKPGEGTTMRIII
jgi:two-component sensor histidine kinase